MYGKLLLSLPNCLSWEWLVLCVVFNYFLQVVGIGRLKILNDGGGVGIG